MSGITLWFHWSTRVTLTELPIPQQPQSFVALLDRIAPSGFIHDQFSSMVPFLFLPLLFLQFLLFCSHPRQSFANLCAGQIARLPTVSINGWFLSFLYFYLPPTSLYGIFHLSGILPFMRCVISKRIRQRNYAPLFFSFSFYPKGKKSSVAKISRNKKSNRGSYWISNSLLLPQEVIYRLSEFVSNWRIRSYS